MQFHDRSVICTATLAQFLGISCPEAVTREVERVRRVEIYQREVFFVRNLGFIEPTAARRISFEETLRFGKMHEEAYREFGFELVYIDAAPVAERVAAVKAAIALTRG